MNVEVGHNERLSLPPVVRIPLLMTCAGTAGFLSGLFSGSRKAGLQFLAENSHRLPRTTKGWYFYHKTKNYKVLLGGVKSGFQVGIRIASWAGLYVATEAAIDYIRGTIDFAASFTAAVATGAVLGSVYHFRRQTMLRTMRTGMAIGLAGGLAQDFLRYAKGENIWYVSRLHRRLHKPLEGA